MKDDLKKLISKTLALYDSIPAAKKFFFASRRRLKDLLYRIESSQIRIAVIGITSSGKSALLNAILGQNLLPTGVAPSSGRQVLCGYGKTLYAEIVFMPESGKERLVITDDITNQLKKYGDERSNSGNREQVDEIHVHSPALKFDHKLIFVDTPGFDAYNLSIHDEITLKLVLPTVDMIMYLTSVKPDSDALNLDLIDRSTSDTKPLIVVQNKINSISEKISKRGIEKTVDDIKLEHLKRLKRLLSKAQKESVRRAPIVQVSAKATWEESNLETLKQVLAEQIELNSSFRENLFARQFIREVEETHGTLSSVIVESKRKSEKLAERKRDMSSCKTSIGNIREAGDELAKRIEIKSTSAEDDATDLLTAIDDKYEIKSSRHSGPSAPKEYKNPKSLAPAIRDKKEALTRKINSILADVSDGIPKIQAAIKASCAALNLQESQVVRTGFFGTAPVAISDCQKVVKGKFHKSRRVEKRGWVGKTQRVFGKIFRQKDWGYKRTEAWTEPDTTKCDIAALILEIENAFAYLRKFLAEKVSVFQRNTEYSIGLLQKEYDRRKREMEEQFQVEIPVEQGNALLASLKEIIDGNSGDISKTAPLNPAQRPGRIEVPLRETDVEPLVLDALRVAEGMALECHWSLMSEIIKRSGIVEKYICGWDIGGMENFRDIFFRDPGEIKIIDFSAPNCRMPNARALIFLLVNAGQAGSYAKKLHLSGAVSDFIMSTAKNGRIVWVMDSVKEFVSISDMRDDTLIEAFAEMLEIARSVMKKQELFEVMACSRELYYTVLLHELYFGISHPLGENKRQQFIEEMTKTFHLNNERKHAIGHYINLFLNSMKG